ncbi:UspA [Dillenia turbinata]|uniref:UspA n=1 Tax=Dillenia turbinata TaxID=194707 RepID=A0AAN8W0J1_9MAGN
MEGTENIETSAAPQETVQQQEHTQLMMQGQKKMKVMVAVDESDLSMYALKWALDHCLCPPADVADPMSEVELVYVVNVQPPFQNFVYPAGPAIFATPIVIDSVRKGQEENAAMILARALQICKDKKVKAETLILHGDPKDMICQAVEQMNIDLLVVGSRGLGMIKRAFLGSVSDYCAHHAKCPILIVKPPAKVSSK